MKVLLIRHGKAFSSAQDPEQSLTIEGRREAERLAAYLGRLKVRVSRVFHSGKTRTRQTAEIFAGALQCPNEIEARSDLSPNDPVDRIADELNKSEEGLCLVGHLPFVGLLASRLLCASRDESLFAFAPSTVLALERSREGAWTVAWMLSPALLP